MSNKTTSDELIPCRDCGCVYPEGQIVAFNDDGTRSCEECSLICELCSKPHYQCTGFDEETRSCAACREVF